MARGQRAIAVQALAFAAAKRAVPGLEMGERRRMERFTTDIDFE
jgi:hypothetical protein